MPQPLSKYILNNIQGQRKTSFVKGIPSISGVQRFIIHMLLLHHTNIPAKYWWRNKEDEVVNSNKMVYYTPLNMNSRKEEKLPYFRLFLYLSWLTWLHFIPFGDIGQPQPLLLFLLPDLSTDGWLALQLNFFICPFA
jgi:hypothetical protein